MISKIQTASSLFGLLPSLSSTLCYVGLIIKIYIVISHCSKHSLPVTLSLVPGEDMSFTLHKSVYHISLTAVIGSKSGLLINQSKLERS